MKEAYPLLVAEFAISQNIQDLPGFCWWVQQTMKRRNRIVSNIKTRFKKNS
jgi:hypothetical protein